MGKLTSVLSAENLTLGTGNGLGAFTTALSGAASSVAIRRLRISQAGTTAKQLIRAEIGLRNGAGTLTTTALAPTVVRPPGKVSGFTASTAVLGAPGRSGIVTTDTGGTYAQVMPFNFMNVAGYTFKPAPDEEVAFPAGQVVVVRFLLTPTSTTGWTFSLWLEEET